MSIGPDEAEDIHKCKSQLRTQKALHTMAAELQESSILLPSAYHRAVHAHISMKAVVDTEKKLHKGLTNEALNQLCLYLTTYQALEQ